VGGKDGLTDKSTFLLAKLFRSSVFPKKHAKRPETGVLGKMGILEWVES
jgi:hypothetical protein